MVDACYRGMVAPAYGAQNHEKVPFNQLFLQQRRTGPWLRGLAPIT